MTACVPYVPFSNIPPTQSIVDTLHVHHSKVLFSEKCIGWGVVQHIPTYELEERELGRTEDEVPRILSLMQYSMDPWTCTVNLSIG